MRSALSLPTLRATFPEGCTATALTRPLWPRSVRRTVQSLAWNRHREPSSEADSRCDLDGKTRCVIDPRRVHSVEGSASENIRVGAAPS